ncbi:MAG: hypothetical protein JWL84_3991 [Rhodospirillales bacterium]|nr:hypothetical protein [Rhodospirillales bacterium]
MPGLDPGIHVFQWKQRRHMDGRVKPGHDGKRKLEPSVEPQHCGDLAAGADP